MDSMIKNIRNKFYELYNEDCLLIRSPGRINIIGEHTDYNEGFVLPAAIDKAVYIAISKRKDDGIYLYAEDYDEKFTTNLQSVKKSETEWANYILGVVSELQQQGYSIKGFNAVISGDLPIGAGMSSSAAVECATVFALNELNKLGINRMQMAAITQKAEHNFAGVMCGIMDMFASLMGKKEKAIKLDCRSLAYEYTPLHLGEYAIVLFNTNVKHSLASSEYNTRRKQCEAGVALIQPHHPEVKSLRDVSLQMLDKYVLPVDAITDKRCRFIVKEIVRLQSACGALQQNDLKLLGTYMFETHDGLSNDYEVSCKELDYLVDAVRNNEAVIGARMMGGGFGGCTINLIRKDAIEDTIAEVSKKYEAAMQLPFAYYPVSIENGTEILK
jgi:galactokinase